jgi:hypothetical protein
VYAACWKPGLNVLWSEATVARSIPRLRVIVHVVLLVIASRLNCIATVVVVASKGYLEQLDHKLLSCSLSGKQTLFTSQLGVFRALLHRFFMLSLFRSVFLLEVEAVVQVRILLEFQPAMPSIAIAIASVTACIFSLVVVFRVRPFALSAPRF